MQIKKHFKNSHNLHQKSQLTVASSGFFPLNLPAVTLLAFLLMAFACLSFTARPCHAADSKSKVFLKTDLKPAKEGAVRKTLRGEVGSKNDKGLAIVYERNENTRSSREMWFDFEEETYLDSYNDLSDIQEGDEVNITYDEEVDSKALRGLSLVRKAEIVEEDTPTDQQGEE
jgi:hypothetical protein